MPAMKYFLGTVNGMRTLFDYAKDIPKDVKAEEIVIQTDKTGLREALQELLTEADARLIDTQVDTSDIPEAKEEFFETAKLKLNVQLVEQFIQDEATPQEIENIFSSLGCRFHEMRKSVEEKGE